MKYILVNDSSGQIEDYIKFEAENLTEARVKAESLLSKKDLPEQFSLYEKVDADGRQLEIPITVTEPLLEKNLVLEKTIVTTEGLVLTEPPIEKRLRSMRGTRSKEASPQATVSDIVQDPAMLDAAQAAAETLVDEVK